MVKMADRISNLLSPPPGWSNDKISSYKAEAVEIYNSLKDGSNYLAKRLRQKIEKYPQKIEMQE
jgi:(p)ppGpp synthase/HD superfamily hydrolase